MSKRHSSIPVPAAVANGANAVDVSDLTSAHLSITSVGTATYKVKVSYDGTNFVQFGADVTADADVSLPDAAVAVRVDCSAYTSGTPKGAISGVRSNSDGR
jgi:hypothetical protein